MRDLMIVYGGGGVVGGAIARVFVREGANIFLAERSGAKLAAVREQILSGGGRCDMAEADARDTREVDDHADAVLRLAGSIDISVNAVGTDHIQGVPLVELALEDFLAPIIFFAGTQFVTGGPRRTRLNAEPSSAESRSR